MTNDGNPRLPGLSSADTRWLIGEAQRVLTDLGEASTVTDDVALALGGERLVGLDNLARTLSRLPRKRWGRAVHDQLSTVVRLSPDRDFSADDLRVKLWPRQRADEILEYEALEPLPGVFAVLAAHAEGFTHEFGRLDLIGDRDDAYEAALTNVVALPRPRHTRRRIDPHVQHSWVEFLDSDDPYGAARIVVLPDLLRRMQIDFPAHGVLVAVPTKFELWVHVPVDAAAAAQTAFTMSWLAYQTWAEDPYPISPDIFLVSPDMNAESMVRPHRLGCHLNEVAMLDLMETLKEPPCQEREAS